MAASVVPEFAIPMFCQYDTVELRYAVLLIEEGGGDAEDTGMYCVSPNTELNIKRVMKIARSLLLCMDDPPYLPEEKNKQETVKNHKEVYHYRS